MKIFELLFLVFAAIFLALTIICIVVVPDLGNILIGVFGTSMTLTAYFLMRDV